MGEFAKCTRPFVFDCISRDLLHLSRDVRDDGVRVVLRKMTLARRRNKYGAYVGLCLVFALIFGISGIANVVVPQIAYVRSGVLVMWVGY